MKTEIGSMGHMKGKQLTSSCWPVVRYQEIDKCRHGRGFRPPRDRGQIQICLEKERQQPSPRTKIAISVSKFS
jgi:hypothetical protein